MVQFRPNRQTRGPRAKPKWTRLETEPEHLRPERVRQRFRDTCFGSPWKLGGALELTPCSWMNTVGFEHAHPHHKHPTIIDLVQPSISRPSSFSRINSSFPLFSIPLISPFLASLFPRSRRLPLPIHSRPLFLFSPPPFTISCPPFLGTTIIPKLLWVPCRNVPHCTRCISARTTTRC